MKYEDLDNSTKVILQVVFVFLALWFLWLIRDIILLLIISLILASAMEPLVDALHVRKVPRIISVFLVYVIFIGVAALVIYLMIPPVIEQTKILQANLPQYGQALQTQFGGLDVQGFLKNLVSGFDGGNVVQNTFGVFNGALNAIAVVVISVYLVAEEKGMKTFVSSLLPSHHHDFALNLINKIQKKMGGWVLGQIIISFGIFLFTYIGLLLLHVQYALVLALLSGLFEIVPYIGPFISAVPAMFIGFIQAPSLAIWVAVLYLLVHEVEGYVLVPKIMEKTTDTSPLLTLVALMIGYQLAGIIGLVISVPIATALTVTVKELWPSEKIP
ncbi:MAG: AI-2E family transporter [Candidatus Doudnabacteria bacterium]|nr:AI-2E family transporter [Candidatus Doudnabacteria bacterium]